MQKETVYDNKFATMWYYPDQKIVYHRIHKFIFGQAFYDFLLTGTDLIKKHHARKWLSDDRSMPVLRKEDTDWGMVNWLPQTVAAGWKYWAIIQPEMPVGQMNTEELVKIFSSMGIIAKYFTTEEDAMRWLDSVD